MQLGQLAGLPLQQPEHLVLVRLRRSTGSGRCAGLRIGGRVRISQRGGVDQVNVGIPRIRVDQLNRHDDP